MKMIRRNPQGEYPEIHGTSFIDPTAVIIGNVKIGKNVFVGPLAVIRADEPKSQIIIGDNSNIQDGVIIHALAKTAVKVGERTSLSHGCIVHGPCKIGKDCFVGFGSVVFNSTIGNSVFIKHLAVVEDITIPAGRIVGSAVSIDSKNSVKDTKAVSENNKLFMKKVVKTNLSLVKGYKAG